MKETNFIKQNHEKWKRLEKAIDNPREKADELSDLFIQITDDLSYSRTFYPNRSIRAYLNWLAQRLFFKIYRAKKLKKNAFFHFWTDELPQIMYESRREVLLAFSVFILSMVIGAFSQSMDPDFATTILGPGYVEETIQNIESGDPLAIYKSSGPFGMSIGIIANNLFVALLCFLFGAFASIGSIGMLVSNGVMVGVFQYFFYERGLLGESFLTIWTHGALEISAIVLAGAAGIVLGKGLLFPGTHHRLKAFQVTAQRGLKMYLGIVPVLIVAGFIEGFITRMTNTPDIIRLLFILGCFTFMIGYFVVYPIIRHRRGATSKVPEPYLQPDNDAPINLEKIKSTGEIFTDILTLYRKYAAHIIKFSAGLAAVFVVAIFATTSRDITEVFSFANYFGSALSTLAQLFNFSETFPYINAILFGFVAWKTHQFVLTEQHGAATQKHTYFFIAILAMVPALAIQYVFGQVIKSGSFGIFLPILLPILLSIMVGLFLKDKNILGALTQGPSLVFKQLGIVISLQLILLSLGFLVLSLASSTILYYLIHFLGMNFQSGHEWLGMITPIFFTFVSEFLILWIFFGFLFGAHLTWFSAKEISEATHLSKAVDNIGSEKRIKGMLRE